MIAPGGIDQIRGEPRVEPQPGEADAGAPPGVDVALEVVSILDDVRVFEQRLEQGDGLRGIQFRRSEERSGNARAVAQRHVHRFVRQRHGQAEQLVAQRLVLAGQGEEREAVRGARFVDQALDVLERRGRRSRPGRRSGRRARQIVHQAHELQLGEQLARPRLVHRLALQVLELHRQRKLPVERNQLPAPPHALHAGEQVLAQLRFLHARGVRKDILQGAVLLEQTGGRLFPDPGDPGNVVDLVPGEREEVRNLLRRHSPLLLHFRGAVPLLVHRVVAADPVHDELHQVLVAGDDDHLPALRAGAPGEGGDDVVGLVSGKADGRNAHRLENAAHQGKLGSEVFGRRAAGRLVFRVELAPLRLRLLVEGDCQVRGVALADRPQQHGGEAVDGVRRHALPRGEMGKGVIGAKDGVGAVHQPERRHRSRVLTSCGRGRASDQPQSARSAERIIRLPIKPPRGRRPCPRGCRGAAGRRRTWGRSRWARIGRRRRLDRRSLPA